MTKVTIIGATGSLGKVVTEVLLKETNFQLVLFSRSADKLPNHERVIKIAASVDNTLAINTAVKGTDLVFVALSGNLPSMIKKIIKAMQQESVKRIIFISSYGIYGELPGQNGIVQPILKPYRKAADILEESNLDYTILRPAWFDNLEDRSYKLIPKGEIIYSNEISRLAIADFVKESAMNLDRYHRTNYGIVRN